MLSTSEVFQGNLDEIALILIEKFGLRFKQEDASLSGPLYRWLDFRCRYVDPVPRRVVLSRRFPKANLPVRVHGALVELINKFSSGENVNPYQGRGLTIRNDTSGAKKHARTDLLYADWNMLHFHLSDEPIPSGQFFSKPSDYLAFCLVGGDTVAIVDVLPHPDRVGFANVELFSAMAESWPDYVDRYELKGVIGGCKFSTSEISQLREAGVTTFSEYNGKLYMGPGGGITSAGTSAQVTRIHGCVQEVVGQLAQMVDDPLGQFRSHPILKEVSDPVFLLTLDPRGLSVREDKSQAHFVIRRPKSGEVATDLEGVSDTLVPEWAISAFL